VDLLASQSANFFLPHFQHANTKTAFLSFDLPTRVMVDARAGTAVRRYRVVKSDNPEDLVFQSLQKGAPMGDNNILSRHIKPAARRMGLGFVNS
jgi:hypothetical protein